MLLLFNINHNKDDELVMADVKESGAR